MHPDTLSTTEDGHNHPVAELEAHRKAIAA